VVAGLIPSVGPAKGSLTVTRLKIAETPPPGTYVGSVPVNRDGAAKAAAVVLKVRDAWPWAIGTVLLGALVGGGLIAGYDFLRNRMLVRRELKIVFGRYVAGLQSTKRAGFYELDDELVPTTDGAQLFPRFSNRNVKSTGVAALYARSWKVDAGRYGQLVDEVLAAIERVRVREELIDKATRLRNELDLGAFDLQGPIANETRALLNMLRVEPSDMEAARTRARQLHEQRRILQSATRALVVFMRVPIADRDQSPYKELSPEALYARHLAQGARTPEEVEALMLELARCQAKLEALVPNPRRFGNVLVATSSTASGSGRSAPHGGTTIDAARSLRASVRRWDWIVGGLVALLTSMAYVVPFYDADWGSASDYVRAFALSLAVQGGTAALWNALPLGRTYHLDARASGQPGNGQRDAHE
jgi:hypothetical protein